MLYSDLNGWLHILVGIRRINSLHRHQLYFHRHLDRHLHGQKFFTDNLWDGLFKAFCR